LTLAPLYLAFRLKSKWIWLKLKMDPGPTKKSLGPGPTQTQENKLFRPGPGSGHVRSSLPGTHHSFLQKGNTRVCEHSTVGNKIDENVFNVPDKELLLLRYFFLDDV